MNNILKKFIASAKNFNLIISITEAANRCEKRSMKLVNCIVLNRLKAKSIVMNLTGQHSKPS